MYMSGFFPCMMFGIPGAALAMIKCAKPEKKKLAIGLIASAALCSFICGVTEPFEFGFMFLAPVLYVIYALLYGIFTMITVALGFRAGFSFSAGAMDLIFSSGSTEDMAYSSTGNRSIYRILCGIPFRNQEV